MYKIRSTWPLNLLAMFGLFAIVAFGVGCDDDDNDINGPDPRGDNEVFMEGTDFSPNILTVASETEVVWTNDDSLAHTVRSGDPGSPTDLLNSGNIPPNQTYTFTFTNDDDIPDTINYFCEIHPTMTGVIIVE